MSNKGMSLVALIITIVVMLILAGITMIITMGAMEEYKTNNINHEESNCKHDWVITSKYDWIRESYKTISKCSICGKEVE